jgi:hypothetical protein
MSASSNDSTAKRNWLDAELYELPLHATLTVTETTKALRVAGGWVYRFSGGDSPAAVFVPFDNEFQPPPPKDMPF